MKVAASHIVSTKGNPYLHYSLVELAGKVLISTEIQQKLKKTTYLIKFKNPLEGY